MITQRRDSLLAICLLAAIPAPGAYAKPGSSAPDPALQGSDQSGSLLQRANQLHRSHQEAVNRCDAQAAQTLLGELESVRRAAIDAGDSEAARISSAVADARTFQQFGLMRSQCRAG